MEKQYSNSVLSNNGTDTGNKNITTNTNMTNLTPPKTAKTEAITPVKATNSTISTPTQLPPKDSVSKEALMLEHFKESPFSDAA